MSSQFFNIKSNNQKAIRKSSATDKVSRIEVQPNKDSISTDEALAIILNQIPSSSVNMDLKQRKDMRAEQREKILSVKTENTYFSSFAPISSIPFAKDQIYLGLVDSVNVGDPGSFYFDYFKVPDKRALFLTNLECRIAPYADQTDYYRLTTFSGDDEFALYGFGFSLVANKTGLSYLAQTLTLGSAPGFPTTLPDVFGSYYVFNQNVLNNNTSPGYLAFTENLNVRVQMNWRRFPQGLGADPTVTKYAVLVRARGYLLNMADYYRFLESTDYVDLPSDVVYHIKDNK